MNPQLQKLLEQHWGIFLGALFVSVIVLFVAWNKSFFKVPSREDVGARVLFKHVLIVFALYFVIAFCVVLISRWFITHQSSEKMDSLLRDPQALAAWVNLFAMGAVFIGLLLYLFSLQKDVLVTVVGKPLKPLSNFAMGMLTWFISFPLVVATSQLSSILLVIFKWQTQEQIAVRFFKSSMENPFFFTLSSIFVILIVPFIEELIFRGFLQNWLLKLLKPKLAIALTALIFSLFHFSMQQGYGNIEIISSLFVLSCFLGFIYYRQRSIFASWGLHATFNGLSVLFMSLN